MAGRTVVVALAACVLLTANLFAQRNSSGAGTPYLNTIIERFEKGLPSFNGEHWANLPSIEHDPFVYARLEKAFHDNKPEGAKKPAKYPAVRIDVEAHAEYNHLVTGLLNNGFGGIILPMVNTPHDAWRLVQSMRFPAQRIPPTPAHLRQPAGIRGWNAARAISYWGVTQDRYLAMADVWPLNPQGELMAIAMIETPEAVDNIEQILNVPGLSAILIGQGDLSCTMGVGCGNPYHPEVEAAVAKIAAVCVKMNKLCGSYQSPPDGVCPDKVCGQAFRVKQGFKLFTSDRGNYAGP
jgi:4-hydroxy-2-oxoheptanedioate aldolase